MGPIIERRQITEGLKVETRADGKKGISGLGIVFNRRSVDLGGWREEISPSAVEGIDFRSSEIVSAVNHDLNYVVGRAPDTLDITVEADGVRYFIPESNDPDYRSLESKVERGIIKGSSFAFNVAPEGDSWREDADGTIVRTVKRFMGVYDLSPVVRPAYPDTTAAKRSFDAFKAEKNKTEDITPAIPTERARKEFEYLKLKKS